MLFSVKGNKLEKMRKIEFKLEKNLQKLTENNLDTIFRLEFISSEFMINNLRVDTLAFDNTTNSFIIIEYKKDKTFSVIDQGFAYLSALINNKSDFILEYNEKMDKVLGKKDVDWSQSRVIFVSPQFTKYQRKSIEFKDLPMELWQVSRYSNDLIIFEELKSPESSESILNITKGSKVVKDVTKEIKVYEESDSLTAASEQSLELYSDLRERILNLGEIEIRPLKTYVSFIANEEFISIKIYKRVIRIILNISKKSLDDPKNVLDIIERNLRFGKGNLGTLVKPEDDLDYLMTLIKQSYQKNS